MDTANELHAIIRRVFEEVGRMLPSEGQVRTELVCDDNNGHYQLGQVGWEGDRRIDDIYLHVDIQDGKVFVQHDGTDLRIAERLVREGVSRESIVLAFHRPDLRVHTDYAPA